MLDAKTRNKLKRQRIREYEIKLFNLEMDKVALESADDKEGVKEIEERIKSLQKACEAIKGMK